MKEVIKDHYMQLNWLSPYRNHQFIRIKISSHVCLKNYCVIKIIIKVDKANNRYFL